MPPFLAYPRILAPDYLPLNLADGSAAVQTALTPSATANTKGSYTQLIASTVRRTRTMGVYLFANPGGTVSKSWLVDIAIGAAASEVVIIPNLCLSLPGQFFIAAPTLWVPVNIPAGTRISARCQTQGASGESCSVKVTLFDGGFAAQGVDALNTSTATSLGTAFTPGNGSKSSYVQLIASTSRAYKGVMMLIDNQASAAASRYVTVAIDLAIGGAGSEVIFLPDHRCHNSDNDVVWSGVLTFVPFKIPAGSRVALRAQATALPNVMGANLYGVY